MGFGAILLFFALIFGAVWGCLGALLASRLRLFVVPLDLGGGMGKNYAYEGTKK